MYEEALKIGEWDLGMLKAAVSSVSDSILESPGDITDLSNNRFLYYILNYCVITLLTHSNYTIY